MTCPVMTQVCDHPSYLTHPWVPVTAERASKVYKFRAEQPRPASHGTFRQGIELASYTIRIPLG